MRLTFFVIISFNLLQPGYGLCQENDSLAALIPKGTIKFSPMHLLNHYPTVQLAYEHGLGREWTIQIDLGYVLRYEQINDDFRNKRGFKLRTEPRYYFQTNAVKELVFYLALDYHLNRINFDRSERREECFDVTCNHRYMRSYVYEIRYREMGSSFKIGKLRWYGNFVFDVNLGLTLRYIRYHHPPGAIPLGGWFSVVREEDRTAFSPYLSARIGYRVR